MNALNGSIQSCSSSRRPYKHLRLKYFEIKLSASFLYGYGTWSRALREENKFWMFVDKSKKQR